MKEDENRATPEMRALFEHREKFSMPLSEGEPLEPLTPFEELCAAMDGQRVALEAELAVYNAFREEHIVDLVPPEELEAGLLRAFELGAAYNEIAATATTEEDGQRMFAIIGEIGRSAIYWTCRLRDAREAFTKGASS